MVVDSLGKGGNFKFELMLLEKPPHHRWLMFLNLELMEKKLIDSVRSLELV
jgi:hypothetical protein